jgi:membrane-bound lytic murein transglycosylase D
MGKNLKIVTQEAVATSHTPKVESSKTAMVSKDSVKSNVTKKNVPDFHVVEKGESLFAISQKYNVSKEDLKEWNQLADETIQVGAKLVLTATKEDAPIGIQNYVIQKGDNLLSIAQKHAVSVDDLMQWNNLSEDILKAGDILKIQVTDKTEVAVKDSKPQKVEKQTTYKKENVYIVQKGDSLYSISQKIKGVTVSDLKKWNGISGGNIKPGMKLKISG